MLQPRENPALVGHEQVLDSFARATASGRRPHAWLLAGAPGIGKATLAYHLARRIVAGPGAEATAADPGGALFRRVAHGSEPDLLVLERTPHPKTGRLRHEITVDQVRAVTADLHETQVGHGGRAVVVDVADELNTEAANAFLKLLEEPPAGVVLLLACHAPGRIPRTIVSRCVRLNLAPLDETAMRAALAGSGLDGAPDLALLTLAKGSPGRYARLQAAGFLDHYAAVLESLAAGGRDRRRLLELAERLATMRAGAGADLVADLLGTVVRRGGEWASRGTLEPPLVGGEGPALARLTQGLPLDRWLALWDKLQRLPFDLDQLNVDPRQALYLTLAAMAGADGGHATS
jgi:DNA polymerase-3 subunit delta'